MTLKVLSMVAVASIAALLHYETENDILYVEKEVVVPVTRAKAFLFIADMSNYRRVSVPLMSVCEVVLCFLLNRYFNFLALFNDAVMMCIMHYAINSSVATDQLNVLHTLVHVVILYQIH